jgi:hypothetical protein
MNIKKTFFLAVALCTAFALAVMAQRPPVNVGNKHGNLRAAQEFIQQAWDKVDVAQKDNHDELGGHASKAKELLAQAGEELKLAAEAANSHK